MEAATVCLPDFWEAMMARESVNSYSMRRDTEYEDATVNHHVVIVIQGTTAVTVGGGHRRRLRRKRKINYFLLLTKAAARRWLPGSIFGRSSRSRESPGPRAHRPSSPVPELYERKKTLITSRARTGAEVHSPFSLEYFWVDDSSFQASISVL
jgi:hypothetical protein